MLKAGGPLENWEDVKGILQYRGVPYIPEIIRAKIISCHYANPLVGYFGIDKTCELVTREYY